MFNYLDIATRDNTKVSVRASKKFSEIKSQRIIEKCGAVFYRNFHEHLQNE